MLLPHPALELDICYVEDANAVLWTLLTATSSLTLFVSSVIAAKTIHSGAVGYGVAVIAGIVLAAGNAWLLERIARAVATRWLGTMYVAAAVWIPFGAFVGDRLTSTVLRLL